MNHEGYRDDTADRAIHNADRMPKHIWNIFKKLNLVAEKSGIEIVEIRDRESGKKYSR